MEYPNNLGTDKALAKKVADFFSKDFLEDLARQTRFVERSTSRLTGQNFLMLNVFNEENAKECSLTDLCDALEEEFGVRMTKQSLDERYNTFAVKYLRVCYEQLVVRVIHEEMSAACEQPPLFKKIELTDATSFKIPDHLRVFYLGGGVAKASIKIHHRYDLLNGASCATRIVSGNETDAEYLEEMDAGLEKGCLYLKDLGYYKLSHLNKIECAGGYFLSRFKSGTNCFIKREGEFVQVSIQELVRQTEHSEIYLGKEKLKVRMVIERMPEGTLEKRLAKVKNKAKTNNNEATDETLFLCRYNVYITNIPSEQLPIAWIRIFYALRWQIELIFKTWKSIFEIDEVRKMSIFRFECYIYGRLIAMLLSEKTQGLFREYMWEEEELEISEYKGFGILKKI
jgi:hypothetical protein